MFVMYSCSLLSSLSLAEAQQLAIKKAVLKATSGGVVAKLCADVASKCEQAAIPIRPRAAPPENITNHSIMIQIFFDTTLSVIMQLESYLSLSSALFKALATKNVALESSKSQ